MDVTTELVMVPVRAIRPYHKNVRKNDATVDKLIELIPKTGFNVPLVLDRQNVIVKGHSRWKAAVRLGMKALPCVYTDADEEAIRLDRLADNRVQEFSAWDNSALALELNLIAPTFGPDLSALDFKLQIPLPSLEENRSSDQVLPGQVAPPNGAEPPPLTGYDEVRCDKCGTLLRVKREDL